jgi:hypothetical protein
MSYLVRKKDGNSFLHIHIPKNAGRCILAWLEQLVSAEDIHKIEHGSIADFDSVRYSYSFAVVRNPYSRIESLYKEAFRILKTRRPVASYIESAGLNIKNWEKGLNYFVEEMVPRKTFYPFLKPQFSYISRNSTIDVDYVLHFENITKEFTKIQQIENCFNSLTHIGKGVDIQEKLTDSSKKIIQNYYSDDFLHLGYKK